MFAKWQQKRSASPKPSHVVWVVEHESHRRLLFFGLEWLPGEHHTLDNNSVGIHREHTANMSCFVCKPQKKLEASPAGSDERKGAAGHEAKD
jgi:hypothetical protein